jgi:hypothetical protein
MLLDIPLFYLYIFTVWLGLILLLIVVTHRPAASNTPPTKTTEFE